MKIKGKSKENQRMNKVGRKIKKKISLVDKNSLLICHQYQFKTVLYRTGQDRTGQDRTVDKYKL